MVRVLESNMDRRQETETGNRGGTGKKNPPRSGRGGALLNSRGQCAKRKGQGATAPTASRLPYPRGSGRVSRKAIVNAIASLIAVAAALPTKAPAATRVAVE